MSDTFHIVCPHCESINRVPANRLENSPNCGRCRKRLFTGRSTAVNEAGFSRRLSRSDLPLLVDFWAPWCAPCRTMAPAFEQAAAQLEPEVLLLKVDTEKCQQLAARFGIRSIPTLAMFRNGRELARTAGAMDAARLMSWARSTL